MNETRIGFIGAGRMGGAVVCRLADRGHRVSVFDPRPEAIAACVEVGAHAAPSAAAAAAEADVLFTSLPTPELVSDAWQELAPLLRAEAVCVDLSTVDPATARRAADAVAGAGAAFLSCALGKGPDQARVGAIPLFVGGSSAVLARIRPLLDDIGNSLHHLGEVEAAAAFKLISNLVGMTNLAVLAEGYALARRTGIDPDAFGAALAETGASSYQSEVRLPRIAASDHRPAFAVDLACKDLRLAVGLAARWGVPTPVGAQGLDALVTAAAHGFGDEDVTAVVKTLGGRHA